MLYRTCASPDTVPHCTGSDIRPVYIQMLSYGEARGSSAFAAELRVFCADVYEAEYIVISYTVMRSCHEL